MRLVQFLNDVGERLVGAVEGDERQLKVLAETRSVYDLALEADRLGMTIRHLAASRLSDERADYNLAVADQRLLPPLDHPDPAHCLVTGTGLTHLGSAQARDAMHARAASGAPLTDSMRLFQWGLEGGKPPNDQVSVQPEWFYKGNANNVTAPEKALISPSFALDGGEEAELTGLYVVNDAGEILRVGFAIGNEFSDHIMEAQNYLYLAHSKLRSCSFGPEVRLGELPSHIEGRVLIRRQGEVFWEAPFLTGEDNMSYTIANLEHHHFKYEAFRKPGDVHIHFFGAAVLSKNAGIATQPGDRFEISAPGFGFPLRNTLQLRPDETSRVSVKPL